MGNTACGLRPRHSGVRGHVCLRSPQSRPRGARETCAFHPRDYAARVPGRRAPSGPAIAPVRRLGDVYSQSRRRAVLAHGRRVSSTIAVAPTPRGPPCVHRGCGRPRRPEGPRAPAPRGGRLRFPFALIAPTYLFHLRFAPHAGTAPWGRAERAVRPRGGRACARRTPDEFSDKRRK